MHVLVTGGAGFIGANLSQRLLASPSVDAVSVLDDLSTGREENLDDQDVRLIVGSILDRELLQNAVDGADAIVHLAARPSVPRSLAEPQASNEVNATGTLAVLEAARRAGNVHVVLASSSSVYGANPFLPKHEGLMPMPTSPYGVSKLAAESYALAYHHSYGLPVLPFRFFNVFGPGQLAGHPYAAVMPTFIDAALRGEPLPVHGTGLQTRDFTFVGTVTQILMRAVLRRVTSDCPVNLAFGTRTSLVTIIAALESLVGHPLAIARLPSRASDIGDSQADQRRLRELFPEIVPVSLIPGLRATIDWMACQRVDVVESSR